MRALALAAIAIAASTVHAYAGSGDLHVVVGSGVGWTTRPAAVTRIEAFTISGGLRDPDEVHDEWFIGVHSGLEVWGDGTTGGGGLSACFVAGARSGRLYSTLGVGATYIGTFVDERGDGHGMFAPHAAGTLGMVTRRHILEIQLRAQRNLVADYPDATLYTVMLGVGRKVVTTSRAGRP
jgi:hypothetical protein